MIKNLKISVLSENTSCNNNFLAEHGLSIYMNINDKKILFDTGQSDIFLKNANALGLNLKNLDAIILSHSHYDHTGGLSKLSHKNVYIHKAFFQPKYKIENDKYKYIGTEFIKDNYKKNNSIEFIEIEHPIELYSDIWLICNLQKMQTPNKFYIKKELGYTNDYFEDEIIMTMNTKKGLIIITGCAHSGIINVINGALNIHKNSKIFGLFGGFHLSMLTNEKKQEIAKKIDSYKIENIGISHCTGNDFLKYLSYGNVFNFNAGDIFEI